MIRHQVKAAPGGVFTVMLATAYVAAQQVLDRLAAPQGDSALINCCCSPSLCCGLRSCLLQIAASGNDASNNDVLPSYPSSYGEQPDGAREALLCKLCTYSLVCQCNAQHHYVHVLFSLSIAAMHNCHASGQQHNAASDTAALAAAAMQICPTSSLLGPSHQPALCHHSATSVPQAWTSLPQGRAYTAACHSTHTAPTLAPGAIK
jgi:hypothetical protein